MARCSFDIHVEDIVGTLIVGATLVMLHPKGNMDFEYLARLLREKQITFMHTVPTLFNSFFSFLKENSCFSMIESLRTLCCGGLY